MSHDPTSHRHRHRHRPALAILSFVHVLFQPSAAHRPPYPSVLRPQLPISPHLLAVGNPSVGAYCNTSSRAEEARVTVTHFQRVF
ncbi:hypothetical protein L210DRAFT_3539753 [Boletus edulis BED1]|uniref:Secreted protein n=1 Tax=Boletus edulis BED1 TaxID=1328754 RepID=A0AAD4BV55_BOLED|nr:hypothetical protein L210DRAFT_3539753 [Boletus edulis BED1]